MDFFRIPLRRSEQHREKNQFAKELLTWPRVPDTRPGGAGARLNFGKVLLALRFHCGQLASSSLRAFKSPVNLDGSNSL
jgi:hypothetical protein